MSLEDGQLVATATGSDGYSLSVSTVVVSGQNSVLANVTATCPAASNGIATAASVGLQMTLSSDTIFSMPLNVSADPDGVLRLAKASVANGGLSEPVMVPCVVDQIVYNSLRTFKVAAGGALTVHNVSGGPPLCLKLQGSGDARNAVTVPCAASEQAGAKAWTLKNGELSTTDAEGSRWCLTAQNISTDNTTTCPGGPAQSYYTDPTADGACQSTSFGVNVARCSTSEELTGPAWTYDTATGFLAAGGSATGKCLSAVGPRQTNNIALSVKLAGPAGAITDSSVSTSGVVAKRKVTLQCGATVQLTIGVATERDSTSPVRFEATFSFTFCH